MADIIDIAKKKDYTALAVEKLDAESKGYKGDRYGNAVHTYVANALRSFIQQDPRFAEVFYKTKRTFADCIKETMKGCGSAISDIEVYRRATKFYFPNSEVEFIMKITTDELPDEEYLNKKSASMEPIKKKKDNQAAGELMASLLGTDKKKPSKPKKEKKQKPEPEVLQLSLF